jgi:hypothetical protein
VVIGPLTVIGMSTCVQSVNRANCILSRGLHAGAQPRLAK